MKIHIDVLTLFPEMFNGPFDESIMKRAQEKGLAEIVINNLRDFGIGPHKQVDDRPYGGGAGMLLKVDVIDRALEGLKSKNNKPRVILLTPQGKLFTQQKAKELSKLRNLILICGHYEGFDERIRSLVDEQISIGEYVLTGGELPAMVVIDSIVRLIPGVLTKEEATKFESFSEEGILEYPQYTRPEEYKGVKVPSVLLSGNHKEIEEWRKSKSSNIK